MENPQYPQNGSHLIPYYRSNYTCPGCEQHLICDDINIFSHPNGYDCKFSNNKYKYYVTIE